MVLRDRKLILLLSCSLVFNDLVPLFSNVIAQPGGKLQVSRQKYCKTNGASSHLPTESHIFLHHCLKEFQREKYWLVIFTWLLELTAQVSEFALLFCFLVTPINQFLIIPLIRKDGDDVIDNITCELTGTESINTQT